MPSLLLAAASLHLGFQVTVTVLVYPALARLPADRWRDGHDRHSRAIVPLVAVVYGGLLAASVAAVVVTPGPATLLALAAALATFAITAVRAAPTHGRLGSLGAADPEEHARLLARLLVADRWRTATALVCALAALVAVM